MTTETEFIQNEVRNRKRWLVVPSSYGVVVMSGHYSEEDVIDFIKKRLMTKAEYNGNISFTIQKVVGSIYRTRPGQVPDIKKNLFDVPIGKKLMYEQLAHQPSTVIVRKPFWMIHGKGIGGNEMTASQGELVVEDEKSGNIVGISCNPYGVNSFDRQVLKDIDS